MRKFTNEQFIIAVRESRSISETLTKIGLRPTGGNYKQFRKYANEMIVDYSHFEGKGWRIGDKQPVVQAQSLSELLVEYSTYNTWRLKKRLIKEKIFIEECSKCKLTEWLGQPIPLELDHINGINTDNRLENLRLLCPNCHAQTDTYRGKNQKR